MGRLICVGVCILVYLLLSILVFIPEIEEKRQKRNKRIMHGNRTQRDTMPKNKKVQMECDNLAGEDNRYECKEQAVDQSSDMIEDESEVQEKKNIIDRLAKDQVQFEKYGLEEIYFEDNVAEKLLEAFYLYGTKEKPYSTISFWSLYGVTNKRRDYYMTQAFYKSNYGMPKGTPDFFEFVVFSNEELGLVRCQMCRDSKKVDGAWINLVENLEILAVHGKLTISKEEMETMIFYSQEHSSFKFERELAERKGNRDVSQWNVERIHAFMLKNQDAWLECGELLARDYEFIKTDDALKKKLWKCIKSNVYSDDDYQNAKVDFVLTDQKRTFYLTMCYYMSDFIKRCGEPDDYGYVIITNNSKGVAFVRFINDEVKLQFKRENIIMPDQQLCDAIWFYKQFYYGWQLEYVK